MENNVRCKDKTLSPQEETAKAALLAECDKLAKAGVGYRCAPAAADRGNRTLILRIVELRMRNAVPQYARLILK
jgi:hypothetical protein